MEETPIYYLDFEDKVKKYDLQIKSLEQLASSRGLNYFWDLKRIKARRERIIRKIYSRLSGWQTVQVARHCQRPIFQDYIKEKGLINDFEEMHGDKYFGDDRAILTGLSKIGEEKLMIIGQNKGRTLKEKQKCNFGCAMPEGYRKASSKMKFAEKFSIPIVTFIDTPGAYPGNDSESRGQARAIAVNLMEMSKLKTPILSIVIGEGGSGGALGIGVCDVFAMLEFAYYSVISPEGGAAILERNSEKAQEIADSLCLRSKDLIKLKLIDEIIPEPLGGAHRNHSQTFSNVKEFILKEIRCLKEKSLEELLNKRHEKLRNFGKNEK